MKRTTSLILFIMLASILAACGGTDTGTPSGSGAASPAASAGTSTEASPAASAGTSTEASPAASGAASPVASGSGAATTGDCTPKGPKAERLLWWTGFLEDAPEYPSIKAVADKYTAATGTPIEIVGVVEQFKEKMTIAGPAGEGPDVFGPRPHDELGEYALTNVALEIPLDQIQNQDDLLDQALPAATVNGKLYGMPLWVESIALIYNKDMVPTPPATWDEFVKTATDLTKDGKYGFGFPLLEQYHEGAILHGMGGYIFKFANGTYDVKDIGLNNEGAVAAFKLMRDMYHKQQPQMPEVVIDRANMHAVIEGMQDAGEVAMSFNGPWREAGLKKAGINYGVAPLPTLPNGEPAKPFLGVQVLGISAQTKNREAALDFVNFATCAENVVELYKGFNKAPVRRSAAEAVSANTNVATWLKQAESGVPMPNHPAMSQVWKPWGDAVDAIIGANAPDDQVKPLLDNAVQQIQDAIKRTE